MSRTNLKAVLDLPWAYLLWQRPFALRKLMPLFVHNPEFHCETLIDVGCGPGTNAGILKTIVKNYIGIDLSESYVRHAARAHPHARFQTADASDPKTFQSLPVPDAVLMNSLMHHLSDEQVGTLLPSVAKSLATGGRLHVIDLILPPRWGVARLLARLDRGAYARPLEEWKQLLEIHFQTEILHEFNIRIGPISFWKLFYWRAVPRHLMPKPQNPE